MRKGQIAIEQLLVYSVAFTTIAVALAVIYIFYPQAFGSPSNPYTNGFPGLNVVKQGYLNGNFIIKFQNLLNENINLTNIYFSGNSINTNGILCTNTFVPALNYTECNLSVSSLPSPFTATITIEYTPTNISFSNVEINITGTVNN